jgi:hypothetical protein
VRTFAAIGAACAALAGAVSATAEPSFLITQTSIGGAGLGEHAKAYRAVFGKALTGELQGGYTRLTFEKLGVEVYFRKGKDAGIDINTWGRAFRTPEGVGPCSPAKALFGAYKPQLVRVGGTGPIALYRLGNLVFRVFRNTVTAVTLGKGKLSTTIAGNSQDCGQP